MIDIGGGRTINPAYVISMDRMQRDYANAGPQRFLIIKMHDGKEYVVEHDHAGPNIDDIERMIREASG